MKERSKEAKYISTCLQNIRQEEFSAWSAWVHDGSHGVTLLAQILWYWKTRMATCIVLCNLNEI
jgi:hypothetical protein